MSAATITAPIRHEPELSGQTIVVIGGRLLLMGAHAAAAEASDWGSRLRSPLRSHLLSTSTSQR
jgi:hypothetical protein